MALVVVAGSAGSAMAGVVRAGEAGRVLIYCQF